MAGLRAVRLYSRHAIVIAAKYPVPLTIIAGADHVGRYDNTGEKQAENQYR
jgi:hypothetical protein